MSSPIHGLRQYAIWLLSSVCLFGFTPCYAKDDAVSGQGYLQKLPFVLSASRLNQPLPETPNAVTVIDRQQIFDFPEPQPAQVVG